MSVAFAIFFGPVLTCTAIEWRIRCGRSLLLTTRIGWGVVGPLKASRSLKVERTMHVKLYNFSFSKWTSSERAFISIRYWIRGLTFFECSSSCYVPPPFSKNMLLARIWEIGPKYTTNSIILQTIHFGWWIILHWYNVVWNWNSICSVFIGGPSDGSAWG